MWLRRSANLQEFVRLVPSNLNGGKPAEGGHVVGPACQDLVVSLDRLLGMRTFCQSQRANLQFIEREAPGVPIVGLGRVGIVEPAQAEGRHQGCLAAPRLPLQMVKSVLETVRQLPPRVGVARLFNCGRTCQVPCRQDD